MAISDICPGALYFRGPSTSGQFAQQWEFRVAAQEPALKQVASSKLRRPLARSRSFNCADVKAGDSFRDGVARRRFRMSMETA